MRNARAKFFEGKSTTPRTSIVIPATAYNEVPHTALEDLDEEDRIMGNTTASPETGKRQVRFKNSGQIDGIREPNLLQQQTSDTETSPSEVAPLQYSDKASAKRRAYRIGWRIGRRLRGKGSGSVERKSATRISESESGSIDSWADSPTLQHASTIGQGFIAFSEQSVRWGKCGYRSPLQGDRTAALGQLRPLPRNFFAPLPKSLGRDSLPRVAPNFQGRRRENKIQPGPAYSFPCTRGRGDSLFGGFPGELGD